MRILMICVLLMVPFVQGCYSFVKTFDGEGGLIAECNSGTMLLGFIPAWGPGCHGSANPLDQTGNAVIRPWNPPATKTECPTGMSLKNGECYPDNSLFKTWREAPQK